MSCPEYPLAAPVPYLHTQRQTLRHRVSTDTVRTLLHVSRQPLEDWYLSGFDQGRIRCAESLLACTTDLWVADVLQEEAVFVLRHGPSFEGRRGGPIRIRSCSALACLVALVWLRRRLLYACGGSRCLRRSPTEVT